MKHKPRVLIRGGGDLASGVAVRLKRSGFDVLIAELAHPLVVRRLVSFAEAVFSEIVQVEEITGQLAESMEDAQLILSHDKIAVFVDPDLKSLDSFSPLVLVDARMRKLPPEIGMEAAPLVIGLGPGFSAGKNCHAVVETMRGHLLGRVVWQGEALPNTGIPEAVGGKAEERVLRAPQDGVLKNVVGIGSLVREGDALAYVGDAVISAPFDGVLRGMMKDGLTVKSGMKIGDLDPRCNPDYARLISDKSLAIGGGVLEAILTQKNIREKIYAPD